MSGGPEQEEARPLMKWPMKEFMVDVSRGKAMVHLESHVRVMFELSVKYETELFVYVLYNSIY